MEAMASPRSKEIEETTLLENYTKCAEIFRENSNGHLLYLCGFCDESYLDVQQLEQHFYEHLDEVSVRAEPTIVYERRTIQFEIEKAEDQTTNADEQVYSADAHAVHDPEFVEIEELEDDPDMEHFDIVFDEDDDHMQVNIEYSSNTQLRCGCCCPPRQFPCFGLLQSHNEQCDQGAHACPIDPDCLVKFHTITEAEAHTALHSKADVHPCAHCGKAYKSEIELSMHCGMRIGTVATFVEEKLKLTKPSIVHDDPIVANALATVPVKAEPEQQLFVCDVCSKMFQFYAEIKQHMKQFHGADKMLESRRGQKPGHQSWDKWLRCKHCPKKYKATKQFLAHMNTHVNVKKDVGLFNCAYCEKTCRTRENLVQHERCHTGERPFECTECGKRFNHSSYINIHMRTHTGEKPYACVECDSARFISKSKLTSHIRKTHRKIRPHACTVCDKKFAAPTNLRDHFRAEHTLDRPFECGVCNKSFAKAKLLRQHEHLHLDNKRYECRYCPMKFAQAAGKHGHERRMHTNETPSG